MTEDKIVVFPYEGRNISLPKSLLDLYEKSLHYALTPDNFGNYVHGCIHGHISDDPKNHSDMEISALTQMAIFEDLRNYV